MKTMKKMIVTVLVFSLMLGSATLPVQKNIFAEEVTNGLSYEFFNKDAGSAWGLITLTSETPGEYDFFWGNGEGEKLKEDDVEFSELGTVTLSKRHSSKEFEVASEYTAIPEGAKELLAIDEDGIVQAKFEIPRNKLFNDEEKYQFAAMGDIHYNRYPKESSALPEDQDLSVKAYNNALKFVNDRGINSVFLIGDLSNQGEKNAYDKFNKANSKYPNMTIYTCAGNHDISWTKSPDVTIPIFKNNINLKKTKDIHVKQIAPNGLDFVYEKNGDYFVFFSQIRAKYSVKNYLVDDAQLHWLHKTLNSYRNKNVFLFFHTYLSSVSGNVSTSVGNLLNPGGYTYDLTYPFGAADEKTFRKILNLYPNVTMFSGHSHWAYDQQKYNKNLNIGSIDGKRKGATLVHIASVSAPRTINKNALQREENVGVRSEGTIVAKYAHSTIYKSVDFKNGKYLSYATYFSPDGKKYAPERNLVVGKTKIKSVGKVKRVSKKSKKFKVRIKYKAASRAYKYQIQYSTSKKFKSKKTKLIYASTTARTVKNLKRKTKYYIRVRAYNYQFSAKVYGPWSAKRKVKTKKK